MKKKIITIGVLMMSGIVFSQVGVGIKEPHKSTLLHLENNPNDYRGLFVPNVPLRDSKDASLINNGKVLNSLLVYNTAKSLDVVPGFYYWQDNEWVRVIDRKDILNNLDNFPKNKTIAVKNEKGVEVLFIEDTQGHTVSVPLREVNIVTTLEDKGKGQYTFTNEEGTKTTIDVAASVINNIEEILNDTTVQNSIYTTVSNQGKEVSSVDGSIQIDNGGQAALNAMQISIANGGVTPKKIQAGSKKQILITNAEGKVEWVDATDEVIIDAVKHNETVTVLEDNKNGTFTYFSEADYDKEGNKVGKGVDFNANTLSIVERAGNEKGIYDFFDGEHKETPLMTISTRANSIYFDNSSTVIEGDNLQEVIENIITQIEVVQGTPSSIKGGEILINEQTELADAVLKDMTLSIAPNAITPEKIEAGGNKQILITNAKGEVVWVDATDEVIIDAVKHNETVTVLLDKGNGTFEYYNEKAIDAKGNLIEENAVKFNANTLSIVERKGKEQGIYDFFDGEHKDTPLMTISTRANSIYFDNSSTVIEGDNLQEVIENIITQIEVVQGTPSSIKGGSDILINEQTELADAVLKDMTLSIAPGAITTEKIQAGGNKQILITNAKGEVVWVDATDEVIIDAVKHNETVTVLLDKGNGTFEYYNEKAIDAKGNLIEENAVKFNANTLSIVERKNEKGIYDFFDGEHKETPLMTISTRANSIYFDNSSTVIEGDNLQEVIENIITKIEVVQGTPSTINGGTEILINGDKELADAVLKDMTLSIAPNAITPEKIQAGGNKQILITNAKGEVIWVDATDEVIIDAVKHNETVTVLEDNKNGTFTYFSEADYDKEGNKVGKGVDFNANTLSIVERKNEKGIYDFFDGEHKETPLMTISTRANAIYFDNSSTTIEGDNLQQVIENIITKIEVAQGTPSTIKGGEILINGEKELADAVLKDMTLSIAPGAITTEKIEAGGNKQILITNAKGEVVWVDATDEVIIDAVKHNETVTVLLDKGNGTFEYYNEKAIDAKGNLIEENAMKFDSNTLNIVTQTDGTYAFYDGRSTTVPVGIVDVPASVITNIEEILNDESVVNVIYDKVAVKGKEVTSVDGSIQIDNGGQATLNAMQISIAEGGVTPEKIQAGGNKQILITNAKGEVVWVDATDEVIIDAVKNNETLTVLLDKGNGTFEYYNEKAIDAKGNLIADKAVKFNANTLSIVERAGKEKGIYDFFDGEHKETPLMTISTRANSIYFDNSSTIIEGDNLQEVIENIITQIEVAQGTPSTIKGGTEILINGEKELADAVLKEMTLSIAPGAITTEKIEAGGKKQILITNSKGEVVWVDATDEVIIDAVKHNETVTVLLDKGNGTFEYYNEKAIDAKGNLIEENAMKFDSNTLNIVAQTDGTYAFYDGRSTTVPVGIVDVPASVITNIEEILNNETVQKNIYNTVTAQGKEVSGDSAIEIIDGKKAALNAMTISLRNGGVTTDKIAPNAVTEEKLFAGQDKKDYIPVVQSDGSVKYQPLTTVVAGEMLSVDPSLEITGEGDASKALLQKLGLQVRADGIGNSHIQNLAITSDKINSLDAGIGSILTADGSGNAKFETIEEAIAPAMHGDMVTDGSLNIKNGENVLFGDKDTQVTIKINDGGVVNKHLDVNAVTNEKILDKTIQAAKLNGGDGGANRVAMTTADGRVEYKALSTNIITEKGQIKTDGIITASDNGVDKVLADVTLSIADKSITADKFNAEDAPKGAVATVTANGGVIYQLVDSSDLANKGNISTDNALTVSDGIGKVLSDVTISVKEKGITNDKLAEKAVTANKMSSAGIGEKHVLVSGEKGEVFWGELGDIVTNTAGNLTTDGIITLTEGTGENTLLANAELSIANNSITSDKLSSKENNIPVGKDKILVTNDAGGFDYVAKGAFEAGGEDLYVGGALEFINSDGLQAVLVETTIDVKNQGISTEKIAEGAVTKAKISSIGAKENAVLTADGSGQVDYQVLSSTAFEGKGANLLADESIQVVEGNQALLKETSIAIAELGVANKHIKGNAVTSDKIGSNSSVEGAVLAADGKGNTAFKTLSEIATKQGKTVTTKDNSLVVTANNKAVLQDLDIAIAKDGVKTNHIGNKEVTAQKIGADGGKGRVLTTNGQGGASFESLDVAIAGAGKTITEGVGITIVGGEQAALKDVTISVADKGINTIKLADKAVTTAKIADQAITTEKIGKEAVKNGQIAANAVGRKEIYNSNIDEEHFSSKAVSTRALADYAVTEEKIKSEAVSVGKIKDAAVTVAKINPADATVGHVLTVEKDGKVAFKATQGENISKGNITESSTIVADNGINAVFKNVKLEVKEKSIANKYIAKDAVGYAELKGGAVYDGIIKDKGVPVEKISSHGAPKFEVLTSDGSGGAHWAPVSGGSDISKGKLTGNGPISVTNGTDAVLKDVTLDIDEKSIQTKHIANDAVGYSQLKRNAVYGTIVSDRGINESKIDANNARSGQVLMAKSDGSAYWGDVSGGSDTGSGDLEDSKTIEVASGSGKGALFNDVKLEVKEKSIDTKHLIDYAVTDKKMYSGNVDDGYVLTADGEGGAEWRKASGGNGGSDIASPKFFYLPAIYVEMVSGQSTSIELYDVYEEQFGSPMLSSNGNSTLPVYGKYDLNYYVTYYDKNVFENVNLSSEGKLSYKVKQGAKPTGRTFFNIVLEVK